MMKLFLTLILLCFSGVFNASLAQFDRRDLTLEEQLGLAEPQEAPATPEDRKSALVNRYYNGCLANPTPALSDSAQETLCSCAAVGMETDMSLEEIEGLYTPVQNSADYRQYFMTEIYGNCLKYPMRTFVLDNCMSNETFRKEIVQYRQVCECAADTTGRYMNEMGPTLMRAALTEDWNSPDPLMTVIANHDFRRMTAGYLRRCVQIHVFDLK